MRRIQLRWLGSAMTVAAALTVWVLHGTFAPVSVYASACCEDCERNLSACYAGCASASHAGGSDTQQACDAACEAELFEGPGACFLHCDFDCGPGHQPVCFDCFVTGHSPHGVSCQNYAC